MSSKYDRVIKDKYTAERVTIDVYDVLVAYDVTCPALQHLVKKALCCGLRGHKDRLTDCREILEAAIRADQLAEKSES
jgi:hypothetical protein